MTAFRLVRDAVLFLAGIFLAGWEVYTAHPNEPSLIVLGLAATMMGLPGTLGVDRLLNRGDDAAPGPAAPPTADEPPPEPPAAPQPRRRHGR